LISIYHPISLSNFPITYYNLLYVNARKNVSFYDILNHVIFYEKRHHFQRLFLIAYMYISCSCTFRCRSQHKRDSYGAIVTTRPFPCIRKIPKQSPSGPDCPRWPSNSVTCLQEAYIGRRFAWFNKNDLL